jgi:hypothetical protein
MLWCGDDESGPQSTPKGVGYLLTRTGPTVPGTSGLKVRFCSMSQQGGTSGHLPCLFLQLTTLFWCLSSLQYVEKNVWWTHNVRLETHDEIVSGCFFQLCLCITFTRKFFLVGFNWLNEDLSVYFLYTTLVHLFIIQKRAVFLLSLYNYFTGRDSVNFLSCL